MVEKIDIVCHEAPEAIGPYSQAIKYGNTLYLSGQIPLDPKTGKIEALDIDGQTRQVLENIQLIPNYYLLFLRLDQKYIV